MKNFSEVGKFSMKLESYIEFENCIPTSMGLFDFNSKLFNCNANYPTSVLTFQLRSNEFHF